MEEAFQAIRTSAVASLVMLAYVASTVVAPDRLTSSNKELYQILFLLLIDSF